MENVNPLPTNYRPVLPAALCVQINQELYELHAISAFIDSRLESIEQFLNNFANQPNETNMNNLESEDNVVDTPLVSPFPHSDNDSDDEEVLNELSEYQNAGTLRQERIINSFDWDDLAFKCMIGFRKFTAYLNPFLPMNIISRKAYNTIMVDGLEGTRRKLVAIIRDVYVFVGNFSSKTKISFSQNVETVSLFTRDAVTTTPVTRLYLMRRSLEVLRKFHWMILGGHLTSFRMFLLHY
ncbi:hypothetical protein Tco_1548801 [Tanacetum coccineum]